MTDSNPVLEAVNGQTSEQYRALETLYHQHPDEFQQWLAAALEVLPTDLASQAPMASSASRNTREKWCSIGIVELGCDTRTVSCRTGQVA